MAHATASKKHLKRSSSSKDGSDASDEDDGGLLEEEEEEESSGPWAEHAPLPPPTALSLEEEAKAKALFSKYSNGLPALSPAGLSQLLMSVETNEWVEPEEDEVSHCMDYPLCDYYINSSHNTYLEGDQLASISSAAMYSRVLLLLSLIHISEPTRPY